MSEIFSVKMLSYMWYSNIDGRRVLLDATVFIKWSSMMPITVESLFQSNSDYYILAGQFIVVNRTDANDDAQDFQCLIYCYFMWI